MNESLQELLSTIAGQGLSLSLEKGRIVVRGPREHLTPRLQASLAHRKSELIALLEAGRDTNGQNGTARKIGPAPRGEALPLSFSEERLWFLDQLEGPSNTYNLPTALQLLGALNVEALSWSVNRIVERHEILRTTYRPEGDAVVRVAAPRLPIEVPVEDLREWLRRNPEPGGAQDAERDARRWVLQQASAPFDLARGPLLSVKLLRIGGQRHVLLMNLHHIVSDGWSASILVREFSHFYAARAQGREDELPPLPLQYSDFAWWQRRSFNEDSLERQLAYWRETLQGAPPLIPLPLDRARPAIQGYDGSTEPFVVPPEVANGVSQLARAAGTTLYAALLAAFKVLLARYCHQEDIVVGSTFANRTVPELHGLIGFFVNTLALRTPRVSGVSFRKLLARVHAEVMEAHAHSEVPFERIVEALHPDRGLSHSPLVQVIFDFHNTPQVSLKLPGLAIEPVQQEGVVARFDLVVDMNETAGGLEGVFEYNTRLFEPATIRRMAVHFQRLLAQIVLHPEARVETLSFITEEERHRALVLWNDSAADYPSRPIHELFSGQARRAPDRIAASCDGALLTYRALEERANAMAHRLVSMGVGVDDRVGLFLDRGFEYLIAMLAVLKAGAAFVPLDPSLPAVRNQAILSECAPAQTLVRRSDRAQLREMLPEERILSVEDVLHERRACPPPDRSAPKSLAYVIYTSGSTGDPKGVMIEHEGMLNHIFAHIRDQGISSTDVMAQIAVSTFDISVWQLLCPLMAGGRTAIITGEAAWDPPRLLDRLEREEATILQTVPSHTEFILGELESRRERRLPHLRWFINHAETLTASQCRRWFRLVPHCPLINGFGATEVSDDSSQFHILEPPPGEPVHMSIGGLLANLTHYVLDDGGHPAPAGVVGEVYIGGIGVGRGYLNDPRLTASVFLPDPYAGRAASRLYRIGDLAKYRSDGTFEFLGRIDFQVRIRGFRVEVGDIEAALGRHPRVRQCAVMAWPDAAGLNQLAAYVIPDGYPAPLPEDLATFLKDLLPSHMAPRYFMFLDAFPVGRTGKMSRKSLPKPNFAATETEYVAPRTPQERQMAELWAEVLQVEKVGLRDNFFTLGGHSLLATRLIARVRKLLGRDVALRFLFEASTVESFLSALGLAGGPARNSGIAQEALARIRRFPPGDFAPLAPAQIPVWYACILAPDSIVYNVNYGGLFLVGPLDVDDFLAAWQAFVDRHDAFRIRFTLRDGRPCQFIGPPIRLSRGENVLDLRGLGPGERGPAIERLEQEHAGHIFDLQRGPLFRLTIVDYGEDQYQVLFVTHHIVWDEQSMMNMYVELSELYNARRESRAPSLPPLAVAYLDYALWMNECLDAGEFETSRRYWLDQYRDMPAALDLPTDFPRPPIVTYRGDWVFSWLPRGVARRLDAYLTERNVTLFMFMLAVIDLYFHRITGQDDIVIGCPIAGREHEDFDSLIGLFATPMPIRCRLDAGMSFDDLLSHAASQSVAAYEHHIYPAANLIEELQHVKDLSRPKLFSVMYGVQNDKTAAIGGLKLNGVNPDRERSRSQDDILRLGARFDLNFIVDRWSSDVCLNCIYNTDLYRKQTVAGVLETINALVDAVVTDPKRPLWSYPLKGSERQFDPSFNRTTAAYDSGATLLEVVEKQASRVPGRTAIVQGPQSVTYNQLMERTLAMAGRLQRRGIVPGDKVVLMLTPSADMIVAMLATMAAGACYVPVSVGEAETRLEKVIKNSEARFAITSSAYAPRLSTLNLLLVDGEEAADNGQPATLSQEARLSGPESLAYILFTSGTTGAPKAICIRHRGLVSLLAATQAMHRMTPADRVLFITPYTFDAAVLDIFWPLSVGAAIVVPEEGASRSPVEIGRALNQHEITVLQTVPIMLEALAEARRAGEYEDPASLRILICGADALSRRIRDLALSTFRARLFNHYGPTEVTVDAAVFDCNDEFDGEITPIGRPIPNVEVFILDEHQLPLPPGAPGELYISSPGLAAEYFNDDKLTSASFVSLDPGDGVVRRLYRTGDRGKFSHDGTIYFIGRRDKQVKIRGNRVELEEVTQTLLSHPDIASAMAVCIERHGPGGTALGAYVELNARVNQMEIGGASYRFFTLAQRPDLAKPMTILHSGAWPAYFAADSELQRLWPRLFVEAPEFQIGLLTEDGRFAAMANAVPIRWNGSMAGLPQGWNHALSLGLEGDHGAVPPNTFFLLTGVVEEQFRGSGLSAAVVEMAKIVATGLGMERVLVAVRPTNKALHPEIDFAGWCRLRRPDGQLVDDWLRMHERVGGRLLSVCLHSQRIEATIEHWRQWTNGAPLPSGVVNLPGTLQPAHVDLDKGMIVYHEPAMWVEHKTLLPETVSWRHLDRQALRAFMAARLPDYMVPDQFRFVERMPLTSNGTVDPRALPPIGAWSGRDRIPPKTNSELQLAEIWKRVLHAEKPGVTDDFFESGGHSLRAVQLLAAVETEFGNRVPLRSFYEDPTIRGLDKLLNLSLTSAAAG